MKTTDQLRRLGIELPMAPPPLANFSPSRTHGSLIFLAAQNCVWNGTVVNVGKLGREIAAGDGALAARICVLNLFAVLQGTLGGDLDRVRSCVRLGGYVNCEPGFLDIAQVMDGASNVLHEVLGPAGATHMRSVIGVNQLPQGAAVAVDGVFDIES